jgi:AAA domain
MATLIAEMPSALRAQLVAMGAETRDDVRRRFEEGEPIPKGHRDVGIFWHGVRLLREGLAQTQALKRLLELNRELCRPPLDDKLVEKQFRGAVKWTTEHPTETERARAEARRVLNEHRRSGEQPGPSRGKRKRALERRAIRSVIAEPVEWAIDGKVPLGTSTLVAGVGGLGKSALLLAWAKEITDAGGNVLIVSYEDAAAQVIRPRFEALGGDLDRLHELYVDVLDGSVSFPTDLHELDRHIRETRARAVLIDPVSASIDLKLDAHKDQDVRVVLGQLAQLAERERLANLMNAHLNKAPSADPYLRINGSTAFYNAARSVLTVTRDPAEPDWQRLVAHHKSNYGQLTDVERWRIEPVTVICDGLPIDTMKMEFVEIAEDVSREDVLAARPAGTEKLEEAVEFLAGALSDGDWHDSAGLVQLAVGISERTLRRAALEELHVEHERRGFPSSTWWRLPSHATPSPKIWHDWTNPHG